VNGLATLTRHVSQTVYEHGLLAHLLWDLDAGCRVFVLEQKAFMVGYQGFTQTKGERP
jgi:hypothetical protein